MISDVLSGYLALFIFCTLGTCLAFFPRACHRILKIRDRSILKTRITGLVTLLVSTLVLFVLMFGTRL